MKLEEKIAKKKAVIGVIGLGYIGLSLVDAFGKGGYRLVGYDYNEMKINSLKKKKPYFNFFDHNLIFSLLDDKMLEVSADSSVLKNVDIIIISVSTSLDQNRNPNLTNLHAAFETINKYLKKDQLIILQSSTYPGTTEEEILPIIKKSPFKIGKDIFLAHVPEVADIGNPDFSFMHVPRIVSGITPKCAELAGQLYRQMGCEIFICSSTRVAESAKLLQNSFRLVNIALINEMKVMFDKMGVDVWEVIEAASCKPFGFTPFYPGPGIGGDCIPVTPLYLIWKAKMTEGPTSLLEQAVHVNEATPLYVMNKIIQGLNERKKSLREAKLLILGVGYKKDVNEIHESPAIKILLLLKNMFADVQYHDPYVEQLKLDSKYNLKSIELNYNKLDEYDAVIILTGHSSYDWKKVVQYSNLVIDTRNVTSNIKHPKKKVIKG